MMKTKELLSDQQIWDMFEKKKNKVELLFESLDYMQQYNGRSKLCCIGLAMGLEYEDMKCCN